MKFDAHNGINKEIDLFAKDVKISYKGPVDERILTLIGDYIQGIYREYAKAGKKMFKVFFELAENISNYSAEKIFFSNKKQIGTGTLIIKETDNNFILITGNPVNNENIIPILDKCEYINTLDRNSLREYKRQERARPQGVKGNAHIGLIQIALTSTNPLDVEVTPIDEEYSYFSIIVKIDK